MTARVSILVLLDHAGRLTSMASPEPGHDGFDPCSPGSCWATIVTAARCGMAVMFRSLFSWIMLGDPVSVDGVCQMAQVSILVLLDHAGRLRARPRPNRQVSILVLLDHAGRPRSRAGSRSRVSDPCSPWIMLGDRGILRSAAGTAREFSILVLLDHAGRLRRSRRSDAISPFRSLFSWIMHRDASSARRHHSHDRRFRSLFSWIMQGDRIRRVQSQ